MIRFGVLNKEMLQHDGAMWIHHKIISDSHPSLRQQRGVGGEFMEVTRGFPVGVLNKEKTCRTRAKMWTSPD